MIGVRVGVPELVFLLIFLPSIFDLLVGAGVFLRWLWTAESP